MPYLKSCTLSIAIFLIGVSTSLGLSDHTEKSEQENTVSTQNEQSESKSQDAEDTISQDNEIVSTEPISANDIQDHEQHAVSSEKNSNQSDNKNEILPKIESSADTQNSDKSENSEDSNQNDDEVLESLVTKTSQMESQLNSLQTELNSMKEEINNLKMENENYKNDITGLKSNVESSMKAIATQILKTNKTTKKLIKELKNNYIATKKTHGTVKVILKIFDKISAMNKQLKNIDKLSEENSKALKLDDNDIEIEPLQK